MSEALNPDAGTSAPRSTGPGRPRGFDPEQALDRALQVFWSKGYEGTSLSDLTEAMAINRPSLYAAFGNKEALFRKALARYLAGPAAALDAALDQTPARAAVETFLRTAAELLTTPGHPAGCLVVQGALSCGETADAIRADLAQLRNLALERLQHRLERACASGELPRDADPTALARYFMTVHQGMSVQAASGARREDLLGVAELAMQAWPTP